jgi:hypothetical protein
MAVSFSNERSAARSDALTVASVNRFFGRASSRRRDTWDDCQASRDRNAINVCAARYRRCLGRGRATRSQASRHAHVSAAGLPDRDEMDLGQIGVAPLSVGSIEAIMMSH